MRCVIYETNDGLVARLIRQIPRNVCQKLFLNCRERSLLANEFSFTIYVDKILRGTKPAELPVEQPTNFELVINMKTAKALGIKFADSILLRADRVID